MSKPRVIAFYLPQYHPITENNQWWGQGFTEWTNVGKAKALFRGHYQPKVPADLGYYDLRLSETRKEQADMAKKYGIDGFCYYHYWFGEGRQLLQLPLEEMMKLNEPDFPFMLCWANESWHSKFWNLDGTVDKKVLIEQKYGGTEEYKKHFDYVLKAFKDERYIKIDEKPAFMIYLPNDFDNLSFFIDYWQGLAKENGLKGIFFIAHTTLADDETQGLLEMGFDGVNTNRLRDVLTKRPKFKRLLGRLHRNLMKTPIVVDYVGATKFLLTPLENKNDVFPTIYPNWDHTPRSGKAGLVLQNSSPNKFKNHLRAVFKVLKNKPPHRQLCFIKSWNEWGEGNYLEPDLKFGKKYLEIFCEVKNEFND